MAKFTKKQFFDLVEDLELINATLNTMTERAREKVDDDGSELALDLLIIRDSALFLRTVTERACVIRDGMIAEAMLKKGGMSND